MKKKTVLLVIVLVTLLSGCSISNRIIENQIKKEAGIENDPDYDKYLLYKENGSIDENGYYIPADYNSPTDNEPVNTDGVHVTFASNNLLDVHYYADEKLQTEINTDNCYFEPGTTIYATIPESKTEITNKYKFDKFLVYKIDDKGMMSLLCTSTLDKNVLFTIPKELAEKEISIIPMGMLQDRELSFKTVFLSEKGEENSNVGTWKVNDSVIKGSVYSFDPTKTFIVQYDYSTVEDEYYFVGGEPMVNNDVRGVVTFLSQKSDSIVDEFIVTLRKYTKVTVENKKNTVIGGSYGIESLKINGIELKKDQSSYVQDGMKNGDIIEIVVKDGFKLTPSTYEDLIISQPLSLNSGKQYTITVNSINNYSPTITISKETATKGEYSQIQIPNGTVSLKKEDDTMITEGDIVDDNTIVEVSIVPNSGYYVAGNDVKNSEYHKKMRYAKYIDDMDKIIKDHPIMKYIQITLDIEDEYGDCEFIYNRELVKGTIKVKQNDVIKLNYSLTDPDYSIDKREGVISVIDGVLHKNSMTISVKVTDEMDGKTISRKDYFSISKK